MSEQIHITVAVDTGEDFCQEVALTVDIGVTVAEALTKYNKQHKMDICFEQQKIGVFGLVVTADSMLNDGDRIEIYKPLRIDPKQARRIRAERAKQRK